MYCFVRNKPYANSETCIPVAYMLYISLIYQPTISTSKLKMEKLSIKKSTIMEAYFLYLLALSPTEQYKPAQNNSLNPNFMAVEINYHSSSQWQSFQQVLKTEL